MRSCVVRDLGRMPFAEAYALQQALVERRKQGLDADYLLLVEHPHVITMGRNGRREHLLASEELLSRAGIEFHHTDRGGDVTYHGPGQLVVYPIFDLKQWKRDVGAYVRGLEQVVIDTLADFGLKGQRLAGCTGVWVSGAKICAIGVHLSRWVTSHGLALNITTDLSYFRYIVPCGLTKPVTSLAELGCRATRADVVARLIRHFERIYDLDTGASEGAVPKERIA
ncbi:MAG: lipoyl(octanoyl) transferase LipB [Bryobacteraceae bacterium]|nr:lipoyl(octanoyl) transferase LipB [Bryobacteraceae bacterium]MDW8376937.1 lipoyl(octanoyl) transferase LipB [Bryobacterales bacterium]